ncbi:MAG TPA: hypothetical protein VGD56_05810, partial [Gemmatirosa sp.]
RCSVAPASMSRLPLRAFHRIARRLAGAGTRFVAADAGATMAEYALLIGVVVLVALVGAKAFGSSVSGKFASEAGRVATP